jgi:UDP-GlcNAc:undecaprenyl-phosphate GlcNAc-1-phosphate transferase
MSRYVLLALFAALGVSTLLAFILRTKLVNLFFDSPDRRKVHQRLVPRIGGFGVLVIYLLAFAGLYIFDYTQPTNSNILFILAVGACVFLFIGLLDDSSLVYYFRAWRDRRKGIAYTNPKGWIMLVRYKFLLEFGLAFGVLLMFGVSYPTIHFGSLELSFGWVAIPVGMLWLVGVSNAFNIIDGIDGLCGGVSLLSMAMLAYLGYRFGLPDVQLAAMVLAGAALGFLVFNWHPAKIFMGDMGSLFFGFATAILSLRIAFANPRPDVMLIVYLAGFPVLEVFVAMSRRFAFTDNRRLSLMARIKRMVVADSNHMHHRLLSLGLNHIQVSYVLFLLTSVFLLLALLLNILPTSLHIWLHAYMALMLILIIGVLYFNEHVGLVQCFITNSFSSAEHTYRIGLLTPDPLLLESLGNSGHQHFAFTDISSEEEMHKTRGLIAAVVIEQLPNESLENLVARYEAGFQDRSVPCLVLTDNPESIAGLIGNGIPTRSVAIPKRPLYIHPVFVHLAHMVGATDTIVAKASFPPEPKDLLQPRKRLLLITQDAQIREKLQAILSGMGFWVDFESELNVALERFKYYRHPVVFVDERIIPSDSVHFYSEFYHIQRNGVVVALVDPQHRNDVFTHLADGAWDIISLPLRSEEVVPKVGRLVHHYALQTSLNFLKYVVLFVVLLLPLAFLAVRNM